MIDAFPILGTEKWGGKTTEKFQPSLDANAKAFISMSPTVERRDKENAICPVTSIALKIHEGDPPMSPAGSIGDGEVLVPLCMPGLRAHVGHKAGSDEYEVIDDDILIGIPSDLRAEEESFRAAEAPGRPVSGEDQLEYV